MKLRYTRRRRRIVPILRWNKPINRRDPATITNQSQGRLKIMAVVNKLRAWRILFVAYGSERRFFLYVIPFQLPVNPLRGFELFKLE